jgi:hypothetical protein
MAQGDLRSRCSEGASALVVDIDGVVVPARGSRFAPPLLNRRFSNILLLVLSNPFSQSYKEGCIRRNVWRCFVNFSSPNWRSTALNGSYRYVYSAIGRKDALRQAGSLCSCSAPTGSRRNTMIDLCGRMMVRQDLVYIIVENRRLTLCGSSLG